MALAFAVDDDDHFEMGADEGVVNGTNIVDDQPSLANDGTYPDWGALFNSTGQIDFSGDNPNIPDFEELGGVFAVFIADDLALKGAKDATTFASSNKNDDAVSSWTWDEGNVPAKTDLSNVYAFAVIDDNNHLIIYLGFERLAPNGDSHIDVEFNQNPVGLDKEPPCGADGVEPSMNGTSIGPPCEFTGFKTVNDLVVTMDFTIGGSLGSIEIRKWNAATDQFDLIATIDEGCNPAINGIPADTICGFNNAAAIDPGDWDTYDSQGILNPADGDQLAPNAFTEIGIDVTEILGETPCFGTIQAKTRSSQSFTSELKDFALSNFDLCDIEVDKTGPAKSQRDSTVTYNYTITNTGVTELFLDNVTDNVVGDIETEALAAFCGSLLPDEFCNFTVDYIIDGGDPDPLVNVVTVNYNPLSNFTGVNLSDFDDHEINLFNPSLSLDKDAPAKVRSGDLVTYTYNATNTGDANLTGCTLNDDKLGPINGVFALASGASTIFNANTTVTNATTNTATLNCLDQLEANVTATANATVQTIEPGIMVEKACSPTTQSAPGDIEWIVVVTNNGTGTLSGIKVLDQQLGLNEDIASLVSGANVTFSDTILNYAAGNHTNVATANGTDQLQNFYEDLDDATCEVVGRTFAGCTPGFWKGNANGLDACQWSELPSTLLGDVFNTTSPDLDGRAGVDTLSAALSFRGGNDLEGAERILLRHAVAAKLNIEHADVNYEISSVFGSGGLVEQVNNAIGSGDRGTMLALKDKLAGFNEGPEDFEEETGESFCPLSNSPAANQCRD